MRLHAGLLATMISYLAAIVLALVAARLTEHVRRLRTMTISALLMMAAAWPLFALLRLYPNPLTLLSMRIALTALGSAYFVLQPSMLASLFPVASRVTGISIGYTMGVVLFGAFAPVANAWAIGVTHDPTAPAFFLVAMGCITLASLAAAARLQADAAPARLPAARTG